MVHRSLTSLRAAWLSTAAEGRPRIGLAFDCPVCPRALVAAHFLNPLDGAPPVAEAAGVLQHRRSGDSLEELGLTPEIRAQCGHRLWVTDGHVLYHPEPK